MASFHLMIRADANSTIGMGHIVRCSALASSLTQSGEKVTFVLNRPTTELKKLLLKQGFKVEGIDAIGGSLEDCNFTTQLFRQRQASKLLIDGYQFDQEYLELLHSKKIPVAYLDDYHHLSHYPVDLIINQNLYAPKMNYNCLPTTSLLKGSAYALLRPEFLNNTVKNRMISKNAQQILMTFGGSDPFEQTLKSLKSLKNFNTAINIKVIVGPSNPRLEDIKTYITNYPFPVELLFNASGKEMYEAMLWCDLAICASGSTCWELAFTGTPMLTIIMTENQEEIAISIENANIGKNLGWYNELSSSKLAEQTRNILLNFSIRKQFSKRGQELIDGKGAQRIVNCFLERN